MKKLNKVGRPKLANDKQRKNAIVTFGLCILMVMSLLVVGMFNLNIIKTGRLKGEVGAPLCAFSDIPQALRYDETNNPNGFSDPYFYSEIVKKIKGNDASYCGDVTSTDLASVTKLNVWGTNSNITSINGYKYFTNVEKLFLINSNVEEIEIKDLPKLEFINVQSNSSLKKITFENLPMLSRYYAELAPVGSNTSDVKIEYLKLKNLPNLAYIEYDRSNDFQYHYYNLKTLIVDNVGTYDAVSESKPEFKLELRNRMSDLNYIEIRNMNKIEYSREAGYDDISPTTFIVDNVNEVNVSFSDIEPKVCKVTNVGYIRELILSNTMTNIELANISSIGGLMLKNYDFKNDLDLNKINIEAVSITYDGNVDLSKYNFNVKELKYFSIENATNEVLDLSGYSYLMEVAFDNIKSKKVDLSNNPLLNELHVYNSDLELIDVSKSAYLNNITTYNALNRDLYVQKGKVFDYSSLLKLNTGFNPSYEIEDNSIISNDLVGKKVGETSVTLKVNGISRYYTWIDNSGELQIGEREYDDILTNDVIVYDVTSDIYGIDNNKNTIDLKNQSIDLSKIKVSYAGLSKEVSNNKLYIKDGTITVATYTLTNIKSDEKSVIKEDASSTKKTTTKKAVKKTTQAKTTTKKATTKKTTTKNALSFVKSSDGTKVINQSVVKNNDNKFLIIINIIESVILLVLLGVVIKLYKDNKKA